jgi:hypothetical protein
MADTANFYGYDFEADFSLLGDEFEEVPGVYVIYNEKDCLEIGETENIKETLETNEHTRNWVKLSQELEIYVAIYPEDNEEARMEVVNHLKEKMLPLCK